MKITDTVKRAAAGVIDFVMPRLCVSCGEPVGYFAESAICAECGGKYRERLRSVCPRCGQGVRECTCSPGRFRDFTGKGFAALGFYERHDDIVGQMVYRLKRTDDGELRGFFADELAERIRSCCPFDVKDAVIVSPPRSKKAQRKYGFDQSALLGKKVAGKLGCVYADAIRRIGGTEQKKLGAKERAQNAETEFAIKDADTLRGRDVIVIDDVSTTGSTVCAAARIVLDAGARSVFPSVLFVTPAKRAEPGSDGLWFEEEADVGEDDAEDDVGF